MLAPPRELAPPPRGNPGSVAAIVCFIFIPPWGWCTNLGNLGSATAEGRMPLQTSLLRVLGTFSRFNFCFRLFGINLCCYRPLLPVPWDKTNGNAFLPLANEVWQGYVFTGVRETGGRHPTEMHYGLISVIAKAFVVFVVVVVAVVLETQNTTFH